MLKKINWETYALALAKVASLKSKDPYIKVGCCLLRHDNTVASLGYNGFPSGMEENWSNREERRKYVNHAEANALRFVRPDECYLAAITLLPCNDCLKSLASYGIKKIVYSQTYDRDQSSEVLAQKFGIEIIKIHTFNMFPKNFF
jgi:dCMP deaminase